MDYREILVTGGTGFIGRRVCRALVERGWLPRLLVRPGSEAKLPEDLKGRCRFSPGDATDRESVENAAQSTDAILHLVGIIREDPGRGVTFGRLHVETARNVLAAARRWDIPRVVHMSALGAVPGGTTAYHHTKGIAEALVRESGLSWTILRPSVVFGEGDLFLSTLSRVVRTAPVVPVPGDGKYMLQPVWVDDVANAFAEALSRPGTVGRSYDVGGPDRFTYDGLLDAVGAAAGRGRVRKVHVPLPLVRAGVRLLSRFDRFPMTPDQLTMLLQGNVCDTEPFRSAFGIRLRPLSDYLSDREGRAGTPGEAAPEEPGKGRPPRTRAA